MRWVAFVRNVMVGREGLHREVLIQIAREGGATDVMSHLATGNVTLTAPETAAGRLAEHMEAGVARTIGREELVAIRPLSWLVTVLNDEPFADHDPSEWAFEVAFLRHDAPPLNTASVRDAQRTVLVRALDRELIAARPLQGGQRPHVNRLLERATGLRATSRGWSTLQRIVAAGDHRSG